MLCITYNSISPLGTVPLFPAFVDTIFNKTPNILVKPPSVTPKLKYYCHFLYSHGEHRSK